MDVVEDEFSLLHRDHEADLMPYLKDHQISFVPYFPLASGLLTGKYDANVSFPADDIRSQISDFQEPRYSQALKAIEAIRPIAKAHNATVAQTVLAWYMQIRWSASSSRVPSAPLKSKPTRNLWMSP